MDYSFDAASCSYIIKTTNPDNQTTIILSVPSALAHTLWDRWGNPRCRTAKALILLREG